MFKSTCELGTPLYTGQPAGSQWRSLQRGCTVLAGRPSLPSPNPVHVMKVFQESLSPHPAALAVGHTQESLSPHPCCTCRRAHTGMNCNPPVTPCTPLNSYKVHYLPTATHSPTDTLQYLTVRYQFKVHAEMPLHILDSSSSPVHLLWDEVLDVTWVPCNDNPCSDLTQ